MILRWGRKGLIAGALAVTFVAPPSPSSTLQEVQHRPSHKLEFKHITPVSAAVAGIHKYQYRPDVKFEYRYLTPVDVEEPPVEEPEPTGGGGRIVRPKSYSQIIRYDSPSKSFELEVPAEPVEETASSYRREIDRFQTAAIKLGFQLKAAEQELDLYQLRVDEVRYKLLLRDMLNVDLFIADLLKQIEDLEMIKKRREEEEVIIALILADEL